MTVKDVARVSTLLLAGAALLALAGPAYAAEVFVGQSQPGASDSGACAAAETPCATLSAGVARLAAVGGGTLQVVPNPDGRTTDDYPEAVTLGAGGAAMTLLGAGDGPNGTRISPTSGTPVTITAGSVARDVQAMAPTGGIGADVAAGGLLERARLEANGGTALALAGVARDVDLVGGIGATLDGGRLVRAEVVATDDGIVVASGVARLLQVVVRPRASTGAALVVVGAGPGVRAELRHVTLNSFAIRAVVDARAGAAALQAADATFAGSSGTDLLLRGEQARVKLRTTNRAPARTTLADGARAGNLVDVDPVDLAPVLTPDGRLSPSSPLIDRGTREGVLARDVDDAVDFDGEHRIQGSNPDIGADELAPARPDGLRWVQVGGTFTSPMWTASPPADLHRVFVVERGGRVRVIKDGQTLATPALDIASKLTQDSERGMASIAFAPDFATSRRVYGFYTRKEDPGTADIELGDIVIAEWTMDPTDADRFDPASERRVMLIEHSDEGNHNGGTVVFGPDGYLWISLGDGDHQPIPSQDLSRPLGKILRIDPRESAGLPYTVPADNPFVGMSGKLGEVWAYGLRNPFRMGFDSATGDLWIGDVGGNRFEELNLLRAADGRVPGANFGWRVTEGNVIFQTGAPVTALNAPAGYVPPVVVRRHDEGERSITAGVVVRDSTIPLVGRVLYADFFLGVTRSAAGVPGGVTGDREVAGLPAIAGVSSYQEDSCDRVYATSLFTGRVLRLTTSGQCIPPPSACSIIGTPARDTLFGTAGADVICGLEGADRILGLEGNDVLVGGDGDDTLIGGLGSDVMVGGDGTDLADYSSRTASLTVTIGQGADDGETGEADDVQVDVERVRGGFGSDHLTSGGRRSRLIGGPGDDVLRGGETGDSLEGEAGNDDLDGGGGSDELSGGDGGDVLASADGKRDTVVCGMGADVVIADPVDIVDGSCE